MRSAQDHLIFLTLLFMSHISVACVSLTQMLVLESLYAMVTILLSMLVCAAPSSCCACLVGVHVLYLHSAPYVVGGSKPELYINSISSCRWQGRFRRDLGVRYMAPSIP